MQAVQRGATQGAERIQRQIEEDGGSVAGVA